MEQEKLQTKDFISIGIFSLIYSVVAFVVGGIAQMTPLTFPLMPACIALFNADIRPQLAPDARERSLTAVREGHASVAAKWQKQGGEARAFLAGNRALSRDRTLYRQDNVARLVADMEALATSAEIGRASCRERV